MSNNAALAVAIVGVVGTLTAALLTQQLAMRAQRDQRREERKEERWRSAYENRRDSCVALSAEARRFEQALRSCLVHGRDRNSAGLEQAWQALTSRYAEAQIILPKTIVDAAGHAYGELRYAYDTVVMASLEGASVIEPAEREELKHRLEERAMKAIRELRDAMRNDLSISDLPLKNL
jgi:hypothetical protein